VVPHHSTDYAINCLTAQIGRDAVGLVVYGRSLWDRVLSPTIYQMQHTQKVPSFISTCTSPCKKWRTIKQVPPGRAVEHDLRLHLTLFFFFFFFSFLFFRLGEGGHRKSGLFKRLSAHTHNPATRTYVKMPLTKPPERKKKKRKKKKKEREMLFFRTNL
jgi:hypothetical protein